MTRCMMTLAILVGVLTLGPAPAWAEMAPPLEGTLAVAALEAGRADHLTSLEKECHLLALNSDLAVLLLPGGFQCPGALAGTLLDIEPYAEGVGQYFLHLMEHPQWAEYAGEVRVLHRQGHTLLLWCADETPVLTPASRARQHGLIQPIRIDPTPKAWSAAAPLPMRPRARTEFHPLIDEMVAAVTIPSYVGTWQTLDDFETRYYNTVQNEAASAWMYDLLESFGLDVEFFIHEQSGPRMNVVATHIGVVNPDQVVYMVGHFDSISESPQTSAPGADDNASGTNAFLEAARIMSNYMFHNTIKFVGFNGEEQGLYGSTAYTNYIAGIGENVIGCYNFDMIAYAGNDPLPPDLVIYTNTNSVEIAEILEDACLEYVPTGVEPVVLVEAMGSSDHAPFWNHGYKAICGIEEEAWGPDFCPWYHTTNDRIEQYPQDYPTCVTMAALAAVAHSAMPMQPDTPYLALEAYAIDDDATGASQGNGNGLIEYSEIIELTLTLKNIGIPEAVAVTGQLVTSDPHTTVLVDQASFGTIPGSGGTASSAAPFVFAVSPRVPDNHEIAFEFVISELPDTLDLELIALAPALGVVAVEVDDSVGGDGDGIPEPGETVALALTVGNDGSVAATNVQGTLAGGAFLTADPTAQSFGDLAPGAIVAAGPFSVEIDPACPALYTALLVLTLTGDLNFAAIEEISFNIGDIFADDMEGGAPGWTHTAGGTGFTDEWHLETYRNHTYGGSASWKCGGAGGADYGDLLHAVLESSPFTLPGNSVLSFWHWMEAETSSAYHDYCYDGGLVQISIDGGAWETIAPEGGYPYLIREGGTPGPFPAETPVFSGAHDWRAESFDLAGYAGGARVRFVFGSDGSATREGWYVDDLLLTLTYSGVEEASQARTLRLHPARPNPIAAEATLLLELPAAADVSLRVFDASGRFVRTLLDAPLAQGQHPVHWDGRTQAGQSVGAGVYWARVQAGGAERTTRLLIAR